MDFLDDMIIFRMESTIDKHNTESLENFYDKRQQSDNSLFQKCSPHSYIRVFLFPHNFILLICTIYYILLTLLVIGCRRTINDSFFKHTNFNVQYDPTIQIDRSLPSKLRFWWPFKNKTKSLK